MNTELIFGMYLLMFGAQIGYQIFLWAVDKKWNERIEQIEIRHTVAVMTLINKINGVEPILMPDVALPPEKNSHKKVKGMLTNTGLKLEFVGDASDLVEAVPSDKLIYEENHD